jgi:hypothetical protein
MFDYLQPGIVVKDRAGTFKRITRIESGKVYWVYADRSDRRQHNAEYDRFIDTHFVVPEMKMPEAQAA